MRLATRADGSRDGTLVVVSDDAARCLPADMTLQAALDDWGRAEPVLRALAERLAAGQGDLLDQETLLAPLPRAWQWLDGSAFPTHGELMQQAFNLPPIETDKPLMYQGMSHRFLSATQDVPFPSEADGIDFEGEFAVVTGDVPMGCRADDALAHVRLILLLNDWSLRTIAPIEMKTGFGWVQAKPACSVASFAVTPDALGDAWRNGRVCLPLTVEINGEWFGSPIGDAMAYGFEELIAHAARTRDLPAGTIIGSGTVSNANHAEVGSTCLSERRAIDVIAGRSMTPFLRFGDRVTMRAADAFGVIDQRIVKA
ncbi:MULTISPECIES: fumarylacetoacetate hydrolase family protein [Sphingomonas]|jgi:fumarylacetoacetate (FAA) hydrolase|uniref:Fumarylacetoacetate hydrolase n=1 Tax=Sphingomonas hankookensis TaxID=563996 RepID=A0ABR5YAG8_9SPHN|nr:MULTISPECIES: fumarylacetoacetate hydrolase family protein [Sphingomonas]KZE11836.1 fumarylacetoacetate hydrolase [Sphingomonas hankookensis]PZT93266.1 MAG: FAA hydrolase family protein [Sphingomonas sp.]